MDEFAVRRCLLIITTWLTIALGGCATIANRDAVVPVKSAIGRVPLYRSAYSKKAFAVAPALIEPASRATDPVYVELASGERKPERPNCRVRYGSGVAGNSTLAVLAGIGAPVVGGVVLATGLAVDYLFTSNGFDCSAGIAIKDAKVRHKASPCYKAMVFPPHHFDELVSTDLAKRWMARATKRTKGCVRFADYEQTKELLAYLNISYEKPVKFGDINVEQLQRTASQLGVTHVVILETDEPEATAEVKVTPRVFNLVEQKPLMPRAKFIRAVTHLSIRASGDGSSLHRSLIAGINLIPNSVTFGPSVTSLEKYRFMTDSEEKKSLPAVFTGWGVTHISHPMAFDLWDVDYGLSTAFDMTMMRQRVTEKGGPREGKAQAVRFDALAMTLEGGLTFHTPIGAIRGAVGAGGAPYRYHDGEEDRSDFRSIYSLGASYTAFVTDHVFFTASHTAYRAIEKRTFVTSDLANVTGWDSVRFSIGYFFPTLRSYAARLASGH